MNTFSWLRTAVLLTFFSVLCLADDCPGNTFNCGDGCIPMDWACDGAADCNDGRDEEQSYCASLGTQVEAAVTVGVPESATTEQPDSTMTYSESPTTDFDTLEIPVCAEDKRRIVENCYKKIAAWVEVLGLVDLNVALFTSSKQLGLIEESCGIYHEFKICLGDIYENPSGCILPEALDSWDRFETYTCQLLLPAASDHSECFQQINNHSCSINHYNIQSANTMANFCNPIFSVRRVLDCAPYVQDFCQQDSQDVLNAIRAETSVSDSLYACSDSITIAGRISMCPRDLNECNLHLEGVNVGEISLLLGNSNSDLEDACKAYIRYRGCMSDKIGTKDSCWPADEPFRFMDTVFSTYCSSDILEGIVNQSSCMEKMTTDSDLFICRAETVGAAKGELSTCRAMKNLISFLDCGKEVAAKQCDNSAEIFVEMVYGRLSDQLISFSCDYSTLGATTPATSQSAGSRADYFTLSPSVHPRCSDNEETGALACLLGLFELQQLFVDFNKKNIFLELADENSQLITKSCSIYEEYHACLEKQIFNARGGQRCAFSANINKMARIGLAPLCHESTRANIQKYRGCMEKLQESGEINQCGNRLSEMGRLVVDLIQGGSDYTLCRVFYLVRELFLCVEPYISSTCGEEPLEATRQAKQLITNYGVEEGCPAIKPQEFDRFASLAAVEKVPDTTDDYDYGDYDTTESPCTPAKQAEFNFCLRPLGQFKPNALSVISDPRQIEDACSAYSKFHECRESVSCKPAWSGGVDKMFEYVCEEEKGQKLYADSKRCLRRVSRRSDMKECVDYFTKNANTGDSCAVSNTFLSCSYATVHEKCGPEAAKFVSIFIMRFAIGSDLNCVIKFSTSGLNATQPQPTPSTVLVREPVAYTYECSEMETTKIKECEEVMYTTVDSIRELFEGGIGSFISNMNLLADIFADGCNKSASFQECAKSAIEPDSSCTVASCVIRAGDGICESDNKAELIKEHLNCVFSLISEPDFGRCIRSSFTGQNLAGLTLDSLKELIPKFIDCASGVIRRKCGEVPVNILRSAGSKPEECILDFSEPESTTESLDASTSAEPVAEPESTGSEEESTTAEPTAEPTSYEESSSTSVTELEETTASEAAVPEATLTETMIAETTTETVPVPEEAITSSPVMKTSSSVAESFTTEHSVDAEPESEAEVDTVPESTGYAEPESTVEYGETSTMSSYTPSESTEVSATAEPESSTEPMAEPEAVDTTTTPLVKTTPRKKPHPRPGVEPVIGSPRENHSPETYRLNRTLFCLSSLFYWITGLLLLHRGLR